MSFGDADLEILKRVETLSGRLNVSNAQIAQAWLLSRPGVTAPIIGASKIKHLDEAIAALDVKLSAEDCAYLEEPYKPRAVAGMLR